MSFVDDVREIRRRIRTPRNLRKPLPDRLKRSYREYMRRLSVVNSGGGGGPFDDASAYWPFASSKSLVGSPGPTLTYTRADAVATYWGSDGLLKTAALNEPRFDHNPATLQSLGLLIEESRTNNALHNRDCTNAAWVKSNITAAKDATGLDGVANSASTLTATAGNGTALQTITIASAAFTTSFYVKRKTGTGNIDITDDNGANWTTLTGLSSSAWTRHDITRTQANPVIGFRIVTSGDEIEVDFTQMEPGAFPTSAIATTTTAVTRAVDSPLTTDLSWFNGSTGAFYYRVLWSNGARQTGTDQYVFRIDTGGGNPNIQFLADGGADRVQNQYNSTGVNSSLINTADATVDVEHKAFYAFAQNDVAVIWDGDIDGTGSALDVDTGFDQFFLGYRAGASQLNGHIAELAFWNTRKSNAFGQQITK